ncbi:MAG: hypothetical protein ABRQ27_08415 [Clostridiaceae bacterium]
MKSVEALFPWLVLALGIVLFTFGLWGIVGGIILIISTMVYFYKNNRKSEFKIICSIAGVALGICVILLVLFTNVNTVTTQTITK